MGKKENKGEILIQIHKEGGGFTVSIDKDLSTGEIVATLEIVKQDTILKKLKANEKSDMV